VLKTIVVWPPESRLVLHTPCDALDGHVQLAKDVHDEHISKSDGTKDPKLSWLFCTYSLNQEGFDVSISPTYTGTVRTTEEYCVRVVHSVVFM